MTYTIDNIIFPENFKDDIIIKKETIIVDDNNLREYSCCDICGIDWYPDCTELCPIYLETKAEQEH